MRSTTNSHPSPMNLSLALAHKLTSYAFAAGVVYFLARAILAAESLAIVVSR